MKSRRNGLILSYGYFVLSAVVSIFMSSFVVRTIGKTDYGIYQSVAAFINYLTLLEFGTGRVMSRNISLLNKDGSEDLELRKSISTVLVLNFGLMAVILALSVSFWLGLGIIYKNSMTVEQIALAKKLYAFPVISLLITFFQQAFNGILLGYENYTFEKLLATIKLITRSVLLVAVLSIRSSILLYAIIDTGLNVLFFAVTVIFVKFKLKVPLRFRYFDKQILKTILPLCLAMLLQGIVTTMNGTLDKFLISIMINPEEVAVYSIAMTIFTMFSSIASLPMGMYMPKVAKDVRQGLRGEELTKTLVQPCRLNIFITGLIAFGFLIVGRQFISILYGKDFLTAWSCAVVVLFPMFLNMANDVIINILDILRKRHIRSIILMGTTALNFALTIWGINNIGIFGAALATGIATMLQVIILNIYYHTKLNINIIYLFRKGFSGIIPSLAVGVICAVPINFFVKNIYLSFVLSGIVYVLIFGLLFVTVGANKVEKNAINKVIHKFIKGRSADVGSLE